MCGVKENTVPPNLWTAFALPIHGRSCGERLVLLIMEMSLHPDCRVQFDPVTMDRFSESDRQTLLHGTWSVIETKTIDRRLGALLHPYRNVQNPWLPSCYSLAFECPDSGLTLEIPLIFRTTLKSLPLRNERPDRWFQVKPFKQAAHAVRRMTQSNDLLHDFARFFCKGELEGKSPLAVPLSDKIVSVDRSVSFLSRLLSFPIDLYIPRGALRHLFVYPFEDLLSEYDLSATLSLEPLASKPVELASIFDDSWSYLSRLDQCLDHLIVNLIPAVPYLSVLFSHLVQAATAVADGTSSSLYSPSDQIEIKYLVAFFRNVAHSPHGCAPIRNHGPGHTVAWFHFPRMCVVTQCGHVFGYRPWIDPPLFHLSHCPTCRVQFHVADIVTFRNPFYSGKTDQTDHDVRMSALDLIASSSSSSSSSSLAPLVPHPIFLDPALIASVCARRKPLPRLLPKPVTSSKPVQQAEKSDSVSAIPGTPPSSPPSFSDHDDDDDDDNVDNDRTDPTDVVVEMLPSVDDWYENEAYYRNAVVVSPFEAIRPLTDDNDCA